MGLNDVCTLRPGPRLDVTTAPRLEEDVQRTIDQGGRRIVIDMSAVTYISSAGIGACLRAAKLVRAEGGRIVLAGIGAQVAKVFELSGLTAIFDFFATMPEALEALGAAPSGTPSGTRPTDAPPELSLAEEILLLALEEDGRFIELPDFALDFALGGAVLADLCRHRRMDSDLERLTVVDATPLGDAVLDPAPNTVAQSAAEQDVQGWIRTLAREGEEVRGRVADRLVARGVLQRDRSRLLWALGRRRYPSRDGRERREVRERVLGIIRTDEIPDPRDVMIIALAEACAVFDAILGLDERTDLRPRIADIARMDLLAQSMRSALVAMQMSRRGGADIPEPI